MSKQVSLKAPTPTKIVVTFIIVPPFSRRVVQKKLVNFALFLEAAEINQKSKIPLNVIDYKMFHYVHAKSQYRNHRTPGGAKHPNHQHPEKLCEELLGIKEEKFKDHTVS